MTEISPELIAEARRRIAGHVRPSPYIYSDALSVQLGRPVSLKLELLQPSGSFKVRGAFSKMLSLDEAARRAGIVAVSGGNHGLAVAAAGGMLGLKVRVFMPKTAPPRSVELIRADGAEVLLCEDIAEAFAGSDAAAAQGASYVHPFDDPLVIAGQATVGLEMLEADDAFTDVFVSIGGGGLAGGIAAAIKAARPQVRVWGVETVGATAMSEAVGAGRPVDVKITSIATTLGAPAVSDRTLGLTQSLLEEVLLVSDADALREILVLADRCKLVSEPAAACTLAAARAMVPKLPEDARIALVLCGGNVTLSEIAAWRERFGL